MTTTMSRDDLVRALVRTTGMPERRAQAIIDNQQRLKAGPGVTEADAVGVTVALPLSITIPWSALVSDNDRTTPIADGGKARIILTERYKTARRAIHALLTDRLNGALPISVPVDLYARVFTPDRRIHDCPDFAKGVHDAMARQVFTNDAWIYRAVWERAGVDVDRPRAEITISLYSESHA